MDSFKDHFLNILFFLFCTLRFTNLPYPNKPYINRKLIYSALHFNITINQSEMRYNFSGNICFRLMIRVSCFYALVNQLSFPTDFRNKLWVGLGLGAGIGLSLYFWTGMLIQDQQKMLIQEHVLFSKIVMTLNMHTL